MKRIQIASYRSIAECKPHYFFVLHYEHEMEILQVNLKRIDREKGIPADMNVRLNHIQMTKVAMKNLNKTYVQSKFNQLRDPFTFNPTVYRFLNEKISYLFAKKMNQLNNEFYYLTRNIKNTRDPKVALRAVQSYSAFLLHVQDFNQTFKTFSMRCLKTTLDYLIEADKSNESLPKTSKRPS